MKKFLLGYFVASWVIDYALKSTTGKNIQQTLQVNAADSELLAKRLRQHFNLN